MITTVEEVHLIILRTACEIANQRWAQTGGTGREQTIPHPEYLPGERFSASRRKIRNPRRVVVGELFRPDPVQSKRGGLTLSVDPLVTYDMGEDEIRELHEMGRNAVKEAMTRHPQLIAGLILGEARKGRNYFDRFKDQDG